MRSEVAAREQVQDSPRDPFADLRGPRVGVPLVQLVMDYAEGDLAVSEVKQALCRFLPRDWQMQFTSVPSFKTTATGFLVGQLALAPRVSGDPPLLLYVNCAPRKDSRDSRRNNEGEGLVYGELANGVRIVAVNSKFSLSGVREAFTVFHEVKIDRGGSQFRSRDNFPPFVAAVAQGKDLSPWLGAALDPLKVIREFKEGFVGYIDSFGNIKTTIRDTSDTVKNLKPGDVVGVDINGTEIAAHVATGSFSVAEGSFAFAPGSSGWDRRFWEVFQRGQNAADTFGNPKVGAPVKITLQHRAAGNGE
jgi:hypothetical protein